MVTIAFALFALCALLQQRGAARSTALFNAYHPTSRAATLVVLAGGMPNVLHFVIESRVISFTKVPACRARRRHGGRRGSKSLLGSKVVRLRLSVFAANWLCSPPRSQRALDGPIEPRH